jgi:hypothetical protein
MARQFWIYGFWKDDRTEFANYIVTTHNDIPPGYREEDIFFFGVSEEDLKRNLNKTDGDLPFVITSYQECTKQIQ